MATNSTSISVREACAISVLNNNLNSDTYSEFMMWLADHIPYVEVSQRIIKGELYNKVIYDAPTWDLGHLDQFKLWIIATTLDSHEQERILAWMRA